MKGCFLLPFVLPLVFYSCGIGIDTRLPSPMELTVSEGFVNPIGFYDSVPDFSWKLPTAVQEQSAYAIEVASNPDLLGSNADLWNSGKVKTGQSTFVKYEGKALSSRQKVCWRVKFWDKEGKESSWSETAYIELGLLRNSDWKGKWIHIPYEQLNETDYLGSLLFRPQYIRREIEIPADIKNARLYITAKGVFEVYVNGVRVSDDRMAPGWVPFRDYIPTMTYDLSTMLRKGKNTVGVVLAEGWYAGRIYLRKERKVHRHTPSLLCQLEIEHDQGEMEIISDQDWKVSQNGPVRVSKIYDGEIYDANFGLGDWCNNGYDASGWNDVQTKALDSALLMPKRFGCVKDQEVINAQSITQPEPDVAIFNFGQNNVGVPELNVPMKKGDTLKVRFAEMLDSDGTLYTKNYRSAKSTDYYVAANDGMIHWRPSFTFHGYQYLELSGYSKGEQPQKEWAKAIVQYSDFESNGTFDSSHKKLNQLQSNITWGLKSNFFDIPTDCPQRDERLGWTGDAQVIAPTAIFNADMYAFWAGYLQSLRYEQSEDGGVPRVVPNNLGKRASTGWGDACVIIPWELYFRTGDTNVLAENYETMKSWVGYYDLHARDYIVETMHAFGDWLQPFARLDSNGQEVRSGDTPKNYIATAYYARSVELTQKTAEVLGETEEAIYYKNLHDSIKTAFQKRFYDEDGMTKNQVETQTQYILAIVFNLITEDLKPKVCRHLKRIINDCDNHLRTGFLGTPILPFALDQAGEIDLMYSILFKETYPSWFYSINQGATTMWERWNSYTLEDGFNKQGMNSFNHYAYGAIGQWMYERIAGIRPMQAGYKKIEIAPVPGGPLTSVQASYNSPYGQISSEWTLENGVFELKVNVPPNTTAVIKVPGDTYKSLIINGKSIGENKNIRLLLKRKKVFELLAQPGSYVLETKY
ncbi:glycoside hydrolase family 78 protein [Reichenbachiella ulvae]|uniref:alpha-L-rhamnosidase n=1 Tax=Reichenbachiella ulvae TaxID=2980104 RepID=A0ABT3CSP4_9BACT|nr:glycoside hydrolase family 78 protein [Reichenbachiella ulvae]MCV9386642.1 glycoside hydrolase family 78 protein [Reichenbachiella ulvae]